MQKCYWLLTLSFIIMGCGEKRVENNSQVLSDTTKTSALSRPQKTASAKFEIGVLEYVDIGNISYSPYGISSLRDVIKVRIAVAYDVGSFGERQIGILFARQGQSGELTLAEAKVFQDALDRIERALPKLMEVPNAYVNMQFENGKKFKASVYRGEGGDVSCLISLNGEREGNLMLPVDKIPDLLGLLTKAIGKFEEVSSTYRGQVENLLNEQN